jgi:ABC-type spermidine/putrescine transport system permease subunit I
VIETQINTLLNWGFGSALAFILLVISVLMIVCLRKYIFLEDLK